MQKRIKKIVVNILAVIVLFLLALMIVTLNSANKPVEEENDSDIATSSFTGPVGIPSGIEGPPGPPPSAE